ncbi:MAG: tetratricopeptide repeat protein, partial [Cyanobacteria bacterium P01_D01_bin.44]
MWNLTLVLLLTPFYPLGILNHTEHFSTYLHILHWVDTRPAPTPISPHRLSSPPLHLPTDLQQRGLRQFQQGQFSQAIATYQQALSLADSDPDLQATLLSQLGHTYANQGDYTTALTLLEIAQQRYTLVGDRLGLAEVDIYQGFVRRRQGRYPEALERLETALERLSSEAETSNLRQQTLTGEALHNLAAVQADRGETETAIALYTQALEIWNSPRVASQDALTQQFHQGRALNNLGGVYYTQGDLDQAETYYQQALTTAQEIANRASEGRILTNLGLIDRQSGRYDQAEQRYQEALGVLTAIGDRASVSSTLNSLGIVYEALGQIDQALDSYQQGLAIAEEIGDQRQIGNLWDGLGGLYYRQARYGKALTAYETALQVHQTIGNPMGAAATLTNLGGTYEALGRSETALDYFDQALAIDDPVNKPGILAAQGVVYQRLRDLPQALSVTQQGLDLAVETGNQPLQSRLLDQLGGLYGQLGQVEIAIATYQKALQISQTSGDPTATGRTLNSLATLYAQQGELNEAQPRLQSALSHFRQIGDRQGETTVLSNLGKLYGASDQPALAILFYKQAVNLHEAIRSELQSLSGDLQQSYLDSITPTYRSLADLLLQQDRVLEAQRVIDLLKVQELDDYLRGVRGNDNTQQGVDALTSEQQIWAEHEQLTEAAVMIAQELTTLRQLDRPLTPDETQRKAQLDEQQRQLVRQFREFSRRPDIVGYVEALSYSAREQSLSLSRLQDLSQNLQNLEQPTVLLYPLILEDRLELILVAPGVPPIHQTVEVRRTTLNETIQAFRTALTDPESDPYPAAQQLYNWLIRPVAPQLSEAQAETILYAPDGPLRYIPLAALRDGNTWLVENYRINNITAASIDDLVSQPPQESSILAGAFTDPRTRYTVPVGSQMLSFRGLPYAGIEVDLLRRLQPNSETYLDPDFNKTSILPNMDDFPIVHFATHAAFLPGSPLDSFILLGNGETITLQEVQDEWFFNNLDLIVLSACQTGLSGLVDGGEEILGFGYLMQNAGANAAIA